jgi:hypothetical protein
MNTAQGSAVQALNNLQQANNDFADRQDPSAYAASSAQANEQIKADALASKNNTFAKQYVNLGRHFDMTHNATYYQMRNKDLLNLENDKLANINTAIQSQGYNTDITRRQVEINNWYYQDKLETLFFLQIFFMSMLAMVILFYFQKTGTITNGFAGTLTFILVVIVGAVGIYRYNFTKNVRDSRWWYKRKFPTPTYTEKPKCGCEEDPFKPDTSKMSCPAKSGNGPCTSSLFSRDKPQQVGPSDTFNRVNKQLENETISYLTTGDMNLSDNSNSASEKGTCSPSILSKTPGSTNVALNRFVLPYM